MHGTWLSPSVVSLLFEASPASYNRGSHSTPGDLNKNSASSFWVQGLRRLLQWWHAGQVGQSGRPPNLANYRQSVFVSVRVGILAPELGFLRGLGHTLLYVSNGNELHRGSCPLRSLCTGGAASLPAFPGWWPTSSNALAPMACELVGLGMAAVASRMQKCRYI